MIVAQVETFLRHLVTDRASWAILVVLGFVLVAAAFSRAGRPELPYVAAPTLLTPAERTFYLALRQAVARDFELFAKVRLGDIIQVRPGVPVKRRFAALGRITSKHADFVLCDPRSFAAALVVELDDRSHLLAARKKRDEFFDAALAVASVPVLRVPVQREYAPEEIRQRVHTALAATPANRA